MSSEPHGIKEILIFHLGLRVETPNVNSNSKSDFDEGASKYTINRRLIQMNISIIGNDRHPRIKYEKNNLTVLVVIVATQKRDVIYDSAHLEIIIITLCSGCIRLRDGEGFEIQANQSTEHVDYSNETNRTGNQ